MQKKVTLELSIDEEFESTIFRVVSDLVAYIEDSEFGINNVNVEDFPKLVMTTPRLGSLR